MTSLTEPLSNHYFYYSQESKTYVCNMCDCTSVTITHLHKSVTMPDGKVIKDAVTLTNYKCNVCNSEITSDAEEAAKKVIDNHLTNHKWSQRKRRRKEISRLTTRGFQAVTAVIPVDHLTNRSSLELSAMVHLSKRLNKLADNCRVVLEKRHHNLEKHGQLEKNS